MAHTSNIEWTQSTWNPWTGCHKVSPGCKNCYMFRDKKRFGQDPNVVTRSGEKTFYAPLKWKEPQKIFTCSWSDFFIEEADPWRDEAFAIMALTPQHTYQVLTKRPDRMLEYMSDPMVMFRVVSQMIRVLSLVYGEKGIDRWHNLLAKGSVKEIPGEEAFYLANWPRQNIWLGVSVEDQTTTDERIPLLLQTPAAVRFLSVEPLLGPVNLTEIFHPKECPSCGRPENIVGLRTATSRVSYYHRWPSCRYHSDAMPGVDWVIVGGESGTDARPMHPDWVRSIRDQCQAADVPFFFKQHGEWVPMDHVSQSEYAKFLAAGDESKLHIWDDETDFASFKLGKKKAGRLLDGREWNEMPDAEARA